VIILVKLISSSTDKVFLLGTVSRNSALMLRRCMDWFGFCIWITLLVQFQKRNAQIKKTPNKSYRTRMKQSERFQQQREKQ